MQRRRKKSGVAYKDDGRESSLIAEPPARPMSKLVKKPPWLLYPLRGRIDRSAKRRKVSQLDAKGF